MPGKKDYVSISFKTHKQKCLLLCNLKELYQEFKVKNPTIGIGFSKFASLRPKGCVAIVASGTHLVCVFTLGMQYSPECYSIMQCITIKNHIQRFHQYVNVQFKKQTLYDTLLP